MTRLDLTPVFQLRIVAILLNLLLVFSCKNNDIGPTGGLKITYVNTGISGGLANYNLYTETSYARNDILQSGTMNSTSKNVYQVTIDDLNPGNYIIVASGGTDRSERVVQVTAGKVREYSF